MIRAVESEEPARIQLHHLQVSGLGQVTFLAMPQFLIHKVG